MSKGRHSSVREARLKSYLRHRPGKQFDVYS